MTDLRILDRIAEHLQAKATALRLEAAQIAPYVEGSLSGREGQERALQLRTNANALLYTAEAILMAAKAELAALEAETHFKERAGR